MYTGEPNLIIIEPADDLAPLARCWLQSQACFIESCSGIELFYSALVGRMASHEIPPR